MPRFTHSVQEMSRQGISTTGLDGEHLCCVSHLLLLLYSVASQQVCLPQRANPKVLIRHRASPNSSYIPNIILSTPSGLISSTPCDMGAPEILLLLGPEKQTAQGKGIRSLILHHDTICPSRRASCPTNVLGSEQTFKGQRILSECAGLSVSELCKKQGPYKV